ncbi:hypothetical protein Thiowin_02782 [Thiorhodovibrio winogradskyi]|uniref:TIGR03016 family PEP-CTERM system-associated outer membrane protein n=1 Tax=Thiorhodovibrio winogradskyi TaxID=77007 RepID=A0ABZ0SBP1_9GAMM|nr:TIGR03016 family PEP-CTERM system-associated outer membrane protein [Thiorhodovibrio winogradskyi]
MLSLTRLTHRRFVFGRPSYFIFIFFAGFSIHIPAAEWTLSKQVSLDTSFSDNINLTDTNPASDFFTSLSPGFVLQGKGSGLTVDLAYAPRLLYYLHETSNNRIDNNLQANAEAEVFREHLFVDFTSSARQEFIDPFAARGDVENTTDNIQTTYSYAVSPLLRSNLGRNAELELRLTNTGVFYSREGSDSYSYEADFQIRSRADNPGRTLWSTQARKERVEYDSGDDDFSNFSILVGYELTRHWTIELSGGYEDNNYAASQETSGSQWGAFLSWVPTSRTSFRLGIGKHYYGTTPSFEFSHQSKRSRWTAIYSRELTTSRSDVVNNPVFQFEDPFGEPLTPNTADAGRLGVDNALPNARVYLSDRLSGQYVLETRRSSLSLNVDYVQREYEGDANEETAVQAALDFQHRLTAKTSGNAGVSWRQTDQDITNVSENANRDEEITVFTGLSRSLSERINVDLNYQFRNGRDYTENRVTLGLSSRW